MYPAELPLISGLCLRWALNDERWEWMYERDPSTTLRMVLPQFKIV